MCCIKIFYCLYFIFLKSKYVLSKLSEWILMKEEYCLDPRRLFLFEDVRNVLTLLTVVQGNIKCSAAFPLLFASSIVYISFLCLASNMED